MLMKQLEIKFLKMVNSGSIFFVHLEERDKVMRKLVSHHTCIASRITFQNLSVMMGPLRCSPDKEWKKNNDDTKKLYFQKSNKWDATRDVLQLEARQYALRGQEREKRKYIKRKTEYWETDISETRKKRPRPKVSDNLNDVAATSTSSSSTTVDLNKLTVKELREEINARGLKPKRLSKMNKTQLLSLLQ